MFHRFSLTHLPCLSNQKITWHRSSSCKKAIGTMASFAEVLNNLLDHSHPPLSFGDLGHPKIGKESSSKWFKSSGNRNHHKVLLVDCLSTVLFRCAAPHFFASSSCKLPKTARVVSCSIEFSTTWPYTEISAHEKQEGKASTWHMWRALLTWRFLKVNEDY